METKTKREIYRQYVALVRAREGIGTVSDLARAYGLTRQRMYQIVREVEDTYAGQTRNREEKNNAKVEREKNKKAAPSAKG